MGISFGFGGGRRFPRFFLETFIEKRPAMDVLIGRVYEALGKASRTNDEGGDRVQESFRKFTHYGNFAATKALGRFTQEQEFKKSCKTLTDYVKYTQAEMEQIGIFDYIRYKELANQEIEQHNESVKKYSKD